MVDFFVLKGNITVCKLIIGHQVFLITLQLFQQQQSFNELFKLVLVGLVLTPILSSCWIIILRLFVYSSFWFLNFQSEMANNFYYRSLMFNNIEIKKLFTQYLKYFKPCISRFTYQSKYSSIVLRHVWICQLNIS